MDPSSETMRVTEASFASEFECDQPVSWLRNEIEGHKAKVSSCHTRWKA